MADYQALLCRENAGMAAENRVRRIAMTCSYNDKPLVVEFGHDAVPKRVGPGSDHGQLVACRIVIVNIFKAVVSKILNLCRHHLARRNVLFYF